MNPWTVALILLLSPATAEIPEPDYADLDHFPVVSVDYEAFKDVVELLGVWRRSEIWGQHLGESLQYARDRRQELESAPPLGDVGRLPPHAEAVEKCAFARQHADFLSTQAILHFGTDNLWGMFLTEARSRQWTWEYLREAANEERHESCCRLALKEVRWRIGPAAYYASSWPPHVPAHRFRDEP